MNKLLAAKSLDFSNITVKYDGTIAIYDNVITTEMCENLINIIKENGTFKKSMVHGVDKEEISSYRSSEEIIINSSKNMENVDSLLFNLFNAAIITYADEMSEILLNRSSSLLSITTDDGYRMLHYAPGDCYKSHVDQNSANNNISKMRIVSAILYLNDDFKGGGTRFAAQKTIVKPKTGRIVLFPSSFSHVHESTPIIEGDKYAIVTWYK